jgi:DNA-binding MarR family transcriptional regulator
MMSSTRTTASDSEPGPESPRAIIHKNILDEAESRPDAAIAEIEAAVSGATEDLVERVLAEYGDPVNNPTSTQESATGTGDGGSKEGTSKAPTLDHTDDIRSPELTEKQREVLSCIYSNPTCTQREIGDLLGVSGATINFHVSSIEGLEWQNRQTYVKSVFNEESMSEGVDAKHQGNASSNQVQDQVLSRLTEIEQQLDAIHAAEQELTTAKSVDPQLMRKVIHACIHADTMTEEDELAVIDHFLSR